MVSHTSYSLPDFVTLDALTTGVLGCESTGRIVYINPAEETLLGISGALLSGMHYEGAFDRSPELCEAIRAALATKEIVTEHDLEVAVNGHPSVRVTCTVTPTEQGEFLLEMRPLDQRLRIARQEQIRMQQEASRDLLRNLAHEIKNPLGGIRGAAQLLEHELPRESLRDYTQVIIKEADRLQSLMERLLTPHRLPRFSRINIHEVLERVRSVLLAETPVGLSITRDYDTSLPELDADPEQLIQAVLNIARNGVQAMQGRGELILRTRVTRQMQLGARRYRIALGVQIIDNGPGIAEDIRDRIFYPLVTGRDGGSGLGLPLAQTLVAQNQGVIECESRPGHTEFSLFFPIQP
jgi:two-component system, NtrC family, nitrogen regulation sensor histidine kinase GlnL